MVLCGLRCKGLMDPRLVLARKGQWGRLLKFSLITASSSIVMVQHSLNDPIKWVPITLVKVIQVPRARHLTETSMEINERITFKEILHTIFVTFKIYYWHWSQDISECIARNIISFTGDIIVRLHLHSCGTTSLAS